MNYRPILLIGCSVVMGLSSIVAALLGGRAAGVAAALVTATAILWYGKSFHSLLSHIPGPRPHLFVGHFPELVTIGYPNFFRQVFQKYGKVARIFEGRRPIVLVMDPELTQQVSAKMFKSFHNRPRFFSVRPNSGLLQLRDQQWKRIRSALVPTFSDTNLKAFQPAINEAIDECMANLAAHCARSEPVDIFQLWSAMTMQVIGSTAFGVRFATQEPGRTEQHPIVQASDAIFRMTRPSNNAANFIIRSFPFLQPAVRWLAHKQFETMLASLNTLDNTSLAIVEKRKADPKMPEYRDFVSLLLQARDPAGNPLSDVEVRDQENVFLLAGYETTANSLSYACFLLSQHPAVLARLQQEIDRLAPGGRVPTFEELGQFTYLEQVVNESSRLYPVAMIVREANEDVEIGGFHIPSGTMVFCPAFVLHYDPESYANPETFDPDRWSADSEENKRRHKYAHVPFGMGPRMCIGARFATEELKLALIRVLQRFTFSLHSRTVMPLEVEHGITLSPRHPIFLNVHPRSQP